MCLSILTPCFFQHPGLYKLEELFVPESIPHATWRKPLLRAQPALEGQALQAEHLLAETSVSVYLEYGVNIIRNASLLPAEQLVFWACRPNVSHAREPTQAPQSAQTFLATYKLNPGPRCIPLLPLQNPNRLMLPLSGVYTPVGKPQKPRHDACDRCFHMRCRDRRVPPTKRIHLTGSLVAVCFMIEN